MLSNNKKKKLCHECDKFVAKANKLFEYMNAFCADFVPTGEEAKKECKRETDVLFQQLHQNLHKIKTLLNEGIYQGE